MHQCYSCQQKVLTQGCEQIFKSLKCNVFTMHHCYSCQQKVTYFTAVNYCLQVRYMYAVHSLGLRTYCSIVFQCLFQGVHIIKFNVAVPCDEVERRDGENLQHDMLVCIAYDH